MKPESMHEIAYYPGFERWWKSIDGVMRSWAGGRDPGRRRSRCRSTWLTPSSSTWTSSGVDVCFGLRESMMDVSGYTTCMSTNAFIIKEIEPYKDRMYLECNVGPILRRGVKHAIWELEFLVKNHNAKLCKVYQPEDDGPLNDRRLWAVLPRRPASSTSPSTVHTGMGLRVPAANEVHPADPAPTTCAWISPISRSSPTTWVGLTTKSSWVSRASTATST